MPTCKFCNSNTVCICYFDSCPICTNVLSCGRPCNKCRTKLENNTTNIKHCKKCGREATFVLCLECNEENAYFCTNCYDNNKMSNGKFYTHCAMCL